MSQTAREKLDGYCKKIYEQVRKSSKGAKTIASRTGGLSWWSARKTERQNFVALLHFLFSLSLLPILQAKRRLKKATLKSEHLNIQIEISAFVS